MAKRKRQRIEAIKHFDNVTEHPDRLKGKWASDVFHNNAPITMELGCGRGDFTLERARTQPERNFIGVDLKGPRLWAGATHAVAEGLHNVFFIRANILDLNHAFEPGDISEVWITFPDPYPKKPRKRMTAARYLDVYRQICTADAEFHLKTDDDGFYEFSLESLRQHHCRILQTIPDVYAQDRVNGWVKFQTPYEKQHLAEGKRIKYIHFSLANERPAYE